MKRNIWIACTFLHCLFIQPVHATSPCTSEVESRWLDAKINGRTLTSIQAKYDACQKRLWLQQTDLEKIGLILDQATVTDLGIEISQFQPLWELKESTQTLEATFPQEHFKRQLISLNQLSSTPFDKPLSTTALDYDLLLQKYGSSVQASANVLFSQTLHGWLLTHQHMLNYQNSQFKNIRLLSNASRTIPVQLRRYELGDAVTPVFAKGSSLGIGGILLQKSYSFNPILTKSPLLRFSGVAEEVSQARLYIDNSLRSSQTIMPGSFDWLSLSEGMTTGEAKLVIQSPNGIEKTIIQPLYSVQNLLGKGNSEYSLALGKQRRGFGIKSGQYGTWISQVGGRFGLRDYLTLEGRIDASRHIQGAGVEGTLRLGQWGLLSGNYQLSHSRFGTNHPIAVKGYGSQYGLRWTYMGKNYNFSTSWREQSGKYFALGASAPQSTPQSKRAIELSALIKPLKSTSIGLSAIRQELGQERSDMVSATIRQEISTDALMSVQTSWGKTGRRPSQWIIIANAYFRFGNQWMVNVNDEMKSGNHLINTTVSHRAIDGTSSHRLNFMTETKNQRKSIFALASGITQWMDWKTEITTDTKSWGGSIGIAGSFGNIDTHTFASRRIGNNALALIKTGAKFSEIILENRDRFYSDENGTAVIPTIKPYVINQLSLNLDQLSLGYTIKNDQSQIRQLPRIASLVTIETKNNTNQIQLRLKLPDQTYAPLGAAILNNGQETGLFVGYDGEVSGDQLKPEQTYLTNVQPICEFSLPKLLAWQADRELPLDLGDIICQPIKNIEQPQAVPILPQPTPAPTSEKTQLPANSNPE